MCAATALPETGGTSRLQLTPFAALATDSVGCPQRWKALMRNRCSIAMLRVSGKRNLFFLLCSLISTFINSVNHKNQDGFFRWIYFSIGTEQKRVRMVAKRFQIPVAQHAQHGDGAALRGVLLAASAADDMAVRAGITPQLFEKPRLHTWQRAQRSLDCSAFIEWRTLVC